MLKKIVLALRLVAGLAGAAFAQGSWICDNALGIYADPNPTSRTAQALANYDGPLEVEFSGASGFRVGSVADPV